jgi:hypothetical protein
MGIDETMWRQKEETSHRHTKKGGEAICFPSYGFL